MVSTTPTKKKAEAAPGSPMDLSPDDTCQLLRHLSRPGGPINAGLKREARVLAAVDELRQIKKSIASTIAMLSNDQPPQVNRSDLGFRDIRPGHELWLSEGDNHKDAYFIRVSGADGGNGVTSVVVLVDGEDEEREVPAADVTIG